jgi:hypothetical protein
VLGIYLKELDQLALSGKDKQNEVKEKLKEIVELHNFLNE